MPKPLIIVRVPTNTPYKFWRAIRDSVLKQRKTGVIILPDNVDVIVAPKDVEIKVEEQEAK